MLISPFWIYVCVSPPGELADEVSQVISELVPAQAERLASFTSCVVQ